MIPVKKLTRTILTSAVKIKYHWSVFLTFRIGTGNFWELKLLWKHTCSILNCIPWGRSFSYLPLLLLLDSFKTIRPQTIFVNFTTSVWWEFYIILVRGSKLFDKYLILQLFSSKYFRTCMPLAYDSDCNTNNGFFTATRQEEVLLFLTQHQLYQLCISISLTAVQEILTSERHNWDKNWNLG